MSAQNIAEHLARLHTLFNVALSEGLIPTNPAYKVKARKANGKFAIGRQGFTSEHVRRIFEALNSESQDFKWIVRLLAYHGMRSGEVCQLRCEDVTNLHGVPVLCVHDRYGSVKNEPSIRDIPIHPECMGILEFAREVIAKHGPDAWLFSSVPAKNQGNADWFHKYGGKFLRQTVGITDRRYTMHSFRHLWRTLARECEMPESVSRSLMGHALGKGEHGAYGSAPSLKLRAQWMAKIDLSKA
jgi:integrase